VTSIDRFGLQQSSCAIEVENRGQGRGIWRVGLGRNL